MRCARVALVFAVVSLLALAAGSDSAAANHSPRWAGAANVCAPESGCEFRDTFVVKKWAWGGQGVPVTWCTNFNSTDKQQLQRAINDWNTAFTTNFTRLQETGSPCDLYFEYDTTPPCVWGCTEPVEAEDLALRGGYYLTGATIHFNASRPWWDQDYPERFRAVAAHELGHFYGMWEQYQDPAFTCWGGSVSIMDVNIPGVQECEQPAIRWPTPWDKGVVAAFYSVRRAEQASAGGGSGAMTYWWWDTNWSEDHVAVHIRRCELSTSCSSGYLGVQVYGYQHKQGVAPWEGDAGNAVGSSWPRGSNPADQYRACFAPWNRVINTYTTYDCSPWVQIN